MPTSIGTKNSAFLALFTGLALVFAGLALARPSRPVDEFSTGAFDYVGFTSNGLNADRIAYYEMQYPGVLGDPANVKRVKVYIGDGANAMTFASAKNLAEDLTRRGYKTVFSTTDGIHGWPWFRRYFAEFAQIVFQ